MLSRVDIIMCIPVIVRYIGESMVSIINVNAGIKECIHGHQNYNTRQILIFGAYHMVRQSLYTWNYYLDDQYHSKPYPYWAGRFYQGIKVLAGSHIVRNSAREVFGHSRSRS